MLGRVVQRARVAGCCWATLRPQRAVSGLADVPLTADHYKVRRGDYAEVGKKFTDSTLFVRLISTIHLFETLFWGYSWQNLIFRSSILSCQGVERVRGGVEERG